MATGAPTLLTPAQPSSPTLLTADTAKTKPPQRVWGIYLNGTLSLAVDSVLGIRYKNESRISDYPQESGAFQSYNKVATPYDVQIRVTKGGTDADRAAFLTTLRSLEQSISLYDVVTPEFTYTSANIQHCDYERKSTNGYSLITADIWFTEVRINVVTAFSNTAAPNGSAKVNVGTVQAQPATTAQKTPAVAAAKQQLFGLKISPIGALIGE